MVRTPTNATPFSLINGCEAVLPLEIQILSLIFALATELMDEGKPKLRLVELKELPAKRLKAQQLIELYQTYISAAYNKKVNAQTFKKGKLVLIINKPMIMKHKAKGKFHPKWKGAFLVEFVYSNGAASSLKKVIPS